jgi:hypothetical protein
MDSLTCCESYAISLLRASEKSLYCIGLRVGFRTKAITYGVTFIQSRLTILGFMKRFFSYNAQISVMKS